MANGPPWFSDEAARQAGETERAAIQGWGPALRLTMIRLVGAIPFILGAVGMLLKVH